MQARAAQGGRAGRWCWCWGRGARCSTYPGCAPPPPPPSSPLPHPNAHKTPSSIDPYAANLMQGKQAPRRSAGKATQPVACMCFFPPHPPSPLPFTSNKSLAQRTPAHGHPSTHPLRPPLLLFHHHHCSLPIALGTDEILPTRVPFPAGGGDKGPAPALPDRPWPPGNTPCLRPGAGCGSGPVFVE